MMQSLAAIPNATSVGSRMHGSMTLLQQGSGGHQRRKQKFELQVGIVLGLGSEAQESGVVETREQWSYGNLSSRASGMRP